MQQKSKSTEVLRTLELAQRLECDIKARVLRPGDAYYSTQEAAEFLGVARIYANNALKLLEKRQLIIRRQRLGALIATPVVLERTTVQQVHFIVPEHYFYQEGAGSQQILMGLQEKLTDASISYCFVRPENEAEKVANLVHLAQSHGGTEGFILVASSWQSQQMMEKSGLPAVIHGTRYIGISKIQSIERDHRNGLHQVVQYLRKRGRRHWSLFMRERIHPGDSVLLSVLRHQREVNETTPLSFTTSLPEQIEYEASRVLVENKETDAVICLSMLQGMGVLAAAKRAGLRPYEDIDIVVLISYGIKDEDKIFARVEIDMPSNILGQKLGQGIADQAAGKEVSDILLPVSLKLPCIS
ncbi:MAG: GntR family transcriptional regulator [Thermoguttaceae bacterium]|nr:GntR family transcriptional regulator [Thermoguttaceae bacterium]